MAGKEDSSDSDGPIIDDNIIRIQLRKPCQRKWELRTRNHSPGVKFPTIQLFDCEGNLLVETNDDNISIKSSEFDDHTLKTSRSLKERHFKDFFEKKPLRKHNTISGDKVYTRIYRTPVVLDDRINGNKGYIINDGNSVVNIPSKLTINNNFPNLQANSLETTPFQSESVSDVSSYKSSDNETYEEQKCIKQTFPSSIPIDNTFYANGVNSVKSSKCSSVSSLSELDQSIEISLDEENEAISGLHKSKSFNDTALRYDINESVKDGVQRSKSGLVYQPPHNKVSFLNTYLKSLPARMSSNPDWFTLHRRSTIESPRISLAPVMRGKLPKFSSEKSGRFCKIVDNTSDNEFINIPTDVAADCEMKKRLKMYRRGLSEIEGKHRVLNVFTKKRRHSEGGSVRVVHTSSSESVDEADVVLNRLKRRILKNRMREKRRSLGEKFQFVNMPLTAAERQKRYKEKLKLDPAKYEEYKRKKRANYHTKKRLINDLTPKEKYNARVIWRLRKKNLRHKKECLNRFLDITPPSSPSILLPDANLLQDQFPNSPQQLDDDTDVSSFAAPEISAGDDNISKKYRGRQKIRRDRSKLYRENLRLQEENEKLKKKYEKYKKRCQRNKDKKAKSQSDDATKYKKLSSAIKERYRKTKKQKDKKMLKNIFENIEDCGRKEIIADSLGITGQFKNTLKVKADATALKKALDTFFQRVDVSRPTSGKKETITRHSQKVQKRFLLDTMKNLYKAFKLENPETKCSYYYFTKNKPFYIVKPSVSGREMCLCKTHTNPRYKAKALKNKGIINNENMSDLIAAISCNPKEQACMYGNCKKCSDLKIQSNTEKTNDKIQWKEWGRIQQTYEKDGNTLKAFKNVKQEKEGTIKELLDDFNEEIKILKKHVYNINVQFTNFRQAVDNLKETEAVIVADFSENYCCKYHEEIQAHHFGGSRLQVSMHTVVIYTLVENGKKVDSYCTVSSNTNHQPPAIWAHLNPVLKDIRSSYPNISTIHFFTDGPFSQYRQKQNFYLSSTILFDYGFKAMTWSFFEAGHGKGPADGIGGFLKRSADDLVARGEDISCAEKFYNIMSDMSKIKLYLISTNDIENIAKQIPPGIQPLPGTKNVHQIFTTCRGELKYRHLSCFCSRGFCDCLSPKIYNPLPILTETEMTKTVKSDKHKTNKDYDIVLDLVVHNHENVCGVKKMPESKITDNILLSSDEDIPLSNYKVCPQNSPLKEIGFLELSQAHNKKWYKSVYKTPETSDEEPATQNPSTSGEHYNNKENCEVRQGDFMLVNVHATKGKIFKYVCVVNDLHEDGEMRVTFLRSVKNKKTFRLDESDVADIDYTDIIEILAEPTITTKRGQRYYLFEYDVHVIEK